MIVRPGEGDRAGKVTIKAGREEVVVTESLYRPGDSGPGPHVHHHHADAFYVLDGRLVFEVGPDLERVEGEAGTFLLVPPDVVHTFRNEGPSEARFLNFHAPGCGFDRHLLHDAPFDQHDPPPDGGLPPTGVVVRPGGERLDMGPAAALMKCERADGIGSLALMETTAQPGFPGPVLHRHERMVDSFYVLDGTAAIRLDDDSVEAGPGAFVLVPPGTAHTFSNPRDESLHLLNLMAPAGLEQYLKELAALGAPPDQETMARIASRYDFAPA